MAATNLSQIELLVLDVDGVMTDGRIILNAQGDEIKEFHCRDGAGLRYWKRLGKKIAIVTGRSSQAVQKRAEDLEIDLVVQGAKNKLPVYRDVLAKLGLREDQAAVVGDDLTDLPMMLHCGFAVAVADAADEVRQLANYVTSQHGGRGAVREVVEHILKSTGLWQQILARYIPGESVESSAKQGGRA